MSTMSSTRVAKAAAPKFKKNGIIQWEKSYSAFLMRDRAHKALSTPRPAAAAAAEKWDAGNDIASSYLVDACDEPENLAAMRIVLDGINAEPPLTAAEIVLALKAEYNNIDPMFIIQALKRFHNLSFINGEKGESFMTRIMESKQELYNLGKVIDDDTDCFGVLLNAMEKETKYDVLSATIRSASGMTWNQAKRIILTTEATSEKPTIEKAKLAGRMTVEKPSLRESAIICQICTKSGHSAKNCFHRNKGKMHSGDKFKKEKGKIKTTNNKKDISEITCFNCGKKGHYSNDCKQPKKTDKGKKKAWDAESDNESSHMLREN
jgi:hypothetical protein